MSYFVLYMEIGNLLEVPEIKEKLGPMMTYMGNVGTIVSNEGMTAGQKQQLVLATLQEFYRRQWLIIDNR